jgi:DNA mismatch repair protein MutL
VGIDTGTTVEVRRLFYNTPARYKFLKTTNTEQRYIIEFISNIALAHPHIAFKLVVDEKVVIQTHGHGKLIDALTSVYDHHTVLSMIPLDYETAWGKISGYLALPEARRKSRRNQMITLNGRIIDSPLITSAVEKSYQGMLPVREYPAFLINISIDPTLVDVNVHPAKSQVRFQDERDIFKEISSACRSTLLDHDLTGELTVSESKPAISVQAVQPSLDLNQYFPWQPKTWEKVDKYLKQENSLYITETEMNSIDLFEVDTVQEKPLQRQKGEPTIKEQLLNARIIGQFRQTYILLETATGLWILDQHIIHERILYERLIKKDYKPHVQHIFTQTLDFTPAESSRISENLATLNSLGMDLEEFGSNSFILRGIPHYLSERENSINEQDILDLVSDLNQDVGSHEKAAVTLACKGAVKAGQRLSEKEIRALLTQLAAAENPFTCPHGRPIIIRFDDHEIDKRFGR